MKVGLLTCSIVVIAELIHTIAGVHMIQCLMSKTEDWSPEPGDEAFELEASSSWLTGTSKGPPDEFDIQDLVPVRHGISDIMISNCSDPVGNTSVCPLIV